MIIPAEKLAGQNSAYSHRKYEGRFRKRRRPSTFWDKNMSVGGNGLADLEQKDSVSRSGAFDAVSLRFS